MTEPHTTPPEPPEANTGSGSSATIHFQGGGGTAGPSSTVTVAVGTGGMASGGAGGYFPATEAPEPEAAPAEPVDHKGLLHELAGHIRVVAASAEKDVTELLAFLASHGL